jgi:glycosyltransferase involved in cell wall biosynthesis
MVLESNFTKKGGGGAESQLRTVALHLMRLGQRVAVVTPQLPTGSSVTAERCFGIPVGRLAYPRWRFVGGGVMCLRFTAFLLGHGRRYDAWHVHIGHNLGALTCVVGALLGKPVVVKISGWWELEQGLLAPNAGLLRRVALRGLKTASAVQAISTRIATELAGRGFPVDRIVVLPNAVDTARFNRAPVVRPETAPFTAVFVGRLVPEKGLTTLFDAWGAAFRGRTDVRLRLVGGGPEDKALREQAARLGITDQVEFLGHRDDVEAVLAEADVGLLPSRIEGLSNTLLEFMACGLPTIASRVSGSEDFVVPGSNGWLFPVGDEATLVTCLREAVALGRARLGEMGRQARADVESNAALDKIVGSLMSLYKGADPRDVGRRP